jgi:hypothetical protein
MVMGVWSVLTVMLRPKMNKMSRVFVVAATTTK